MSKQSRAKQSPLNVHLVSRKTGHAYSDEVRKDMDPILDVSILRACVDPIYYTKPLTQGTAGEAGGRGKRTTLVAGRAGAGSPLPAASG